MKLTTMDTENNGSAHNVKSGEILKAKIKAGIIQDYSQKNSENPFK